jgi:hypothetical protein
MDEVNYNLSPGTMFANTPCIVVLGGADGTCHGPFLDAAGAVAWVTRHRLEQEAELCPLHDPEAFNEP